MLEDLSRRVAVAAFLIALFLTGAAWADNLHLELNTNLSEIEILADAVLAQDGNVTRIGGGGLFAEDDEAIFHLDLSVNNELIIPGAQVGLGFKGISGTMKEPGVKHDLAAVGFLLRIGYEIGEDVSPIPIGFEADMTVAPDPLSFMDATRYLDTRAVIGLHLVRNASVVIGYRFREVRFEDSEAATTMNREGVFVGYRLRF